MSSFLAVANTGLSSVLRHPVRSVVTTCGIIAVLVPYLAGLGLSNGIRLEAEQSIARGADLYVSATQFGRSVPLPLSLISTVEKIDGVTAVVPRIVARVVLGKDRVEAVLVGIPKQRLGSEIDCVQGRLYDDAQPNEFVIGSQLANRLQLKVGSVLLPFYHNSSGDRVSKVVGIFESGAPLWQANTMLTSLQTASAIFDQPLHATSLLVYCRPGYQTEVRSAVLRSLAPPLDKTRNAIHFEVVGRDDLSAVIPRGLLHREGIFNLHFLLAFSVAVMVVLVCSGFGLSERRREVGILKALGWQTDEIIVRSLVECVLLSIGGTAISIVLAYGWLKGLNGYWIASVFISGLDAAPNFEVPFRLYPVPVLLTFIVSLVVVMCGTLYSTWRAATVSPREAMR